MGRASQRKKRSQVKPDFPFNMLMMRIKHYNSQGEHCKCGNEVLYKFEHYMDVLTLAANPRQIDHVWGKVITDQLAGQYCLYHTTYHCEQCMHQVMESVVGRNPATLITMVAMLAPHQSIVLGNKLQTPQDEGLSFTTLVPANTSIAELGRLLKKDAPSIHLG
jgi:hypothetical protein